MELVNEEQTSWLDRPIRMPAANEKTGASTIQLKLEIIVYTVLLVLAIASRFYILGSRVMSHDETSHTYFSWRLFAGQGYQHDPMMHGPLQFHLVALSFLLFGDNDFTARIPAALFSIATVLFMWNYRRYLGKLGALLAAVMMLISPYMLYYGRYVRNEAFIGLFGVVTLWSTLRYFETGQTRYTFWLIGAIVLHFTSKETSYIYTAQLLLFLGFYFFLRIFRHPWANEDAKIPFVIALLSGAGLAAGWVVSRLVILVPFAVLALIVALYYLIAGHHRPRLTFSQNQNFIFGLIGVPALIGITLGYGLLIKGSAAVNRLVGFASATSAAQRTGSIWYILVVILPALIPAAGLAYCGYLLGLTVGRVWPFGRERSFDLLFLVGTMILPALSAFLIKYYANPNAADLANITLMVVMLLPMIALSIGLGVGWSQRLWLANAGLFYGIFIVFYTTFFTNIAGFFTGMVGSLGYWLAQQGVARGSQPWWYYLLLQIPMYEFLPALGCLLAAGILIYRLAIGKGHELEAESTVEDSSLSKGAGKPGSQVQVGAAPAQQHPPVLRLFAFWSVSSLVAFSYAGEKMPWLTVHITLPMILLAAWAISRLVETTDWKMFRTYHGWIVIVLLPLFLASIVGFLNGVMDMISILRGGATLASNLDMWTLVGHVVIAGLAAIGSIIGLIYILKDWLPEQFVRLLGVLFFLVMGVLTARSAMMASYKNYNLATEYLVFAHCGPGPKLALAQIEAVSERLTGGTGIQVAYDDKTTYPFWWYLRNYPNYHYYGDTPNRDLRDIPLILVGDSNYSKIESIVRQDYYMFEYVRMWWPNQDYMVYKWTPKLIWDTLTNPTKRQAIWNIWLSRDYTAYGQVYGKDMSLPNWDPSEHFRLYVRKDIAAQLWSYSTSPQAAVPGPYDGKLANLTADKVIGGTGSAEGQFTSPRGMAMAPDGSLYVADTGNGRIQHLSPQGDVLQVWGSAYTGDGTPPDGQFKEPWDVAVGPDGSVYVADTWDHRVQKFTADGKFISSWGSGIISDPSNLLGFYGPRGITTDSQGDVFITDTGNKRVVFFDKDGKPLGQFGEGGTNPGQLEEPVGLTLDSGGNLYVVDTWNQRVQVFARDLNGAYTYASTWDVNGWDGVTPTNYPYIAVDANGHIFVTDPDTNRVIEFTTSGDVVRYWEDGGTNAGAFNLPVGIAVDPQGGVWVVDSGNGRLLHFTLP